MNWYRTIFAFPQQGDDDPQFPANPPEEIPPEAGEPQDIVEEPAGGEEVIGVPQMAELGEGGEVVPPAEQETPPQPTRVMSDEERKRKENPRIDDVFEIGAMDQDELEKKLHRVERNLLKANKMAERLGQAPLRYVFSGVYQKPVRGPNNIIDYYPHVKLTVSGVRPSPYGTAFKTVVDPQSGERIEKEVGYKLVAEISHNPVVDPKVWRFASKEELDAAYPQLRADYTVEGIKAMNVAPDLQDEFRTRMQDNDNWMIRQNSARQWEIIFKGLYENTEEDKFPDTPPVNPSFLMKSPLFCEHCNELKIGGSGRKTTFVAIEYDPIKLAEGSITEEDIKKMPQRLLGSTCVRGHTDTIKFLNELDKLRNFTIQQQQTETDKTRKSDYLGGGFRAPRDLMQVLSAAAALIRQEGYQANRYTGNSTGGKLRRWFGYQFRDEGKEPSWGEPTTQDLAIAQQARNDMIRRGKQPGLSRQEEKMVSIATGKTIGMGDIDLAGDIVNAYLTKNQPEEEMDTITTAPDATPIEEDFVGDVGSKVVFKGKVESSFASRGRWRGYITKFRDPSGNLYVTFSKEEWQTTDEVSGDPRYVEKGDIVYVSGQIGKHSVYNDTYRKKEEKQNILLDKSVKILSEADAKAEVAQGGTYNFTEPPKPKSSQQMTQVKDLVKNMGERAEAAIAGGRKPLEILDLFVDTWAKKMTELGMPPMKDIDDLKQSLMYVLRYQGQDSFIQALKNLHRLYRE